MTAGSTSTADLATYVAAAATLIGVMIPFLMQLRKRRAARHNADLQAAIHAEIRTDGKDGTQLVIENWRQLTDALRDERSALSDELDKRSASFQADIERLQNKLSSAELRISELEDDNARLHTENAELYRKLGERRE